MIVGDLITFLNTKADLISALPGGIYFGLPTQDKTKTYCIINLISQNQITSVEKRARLEIRIIGGDTSVSYGTLCDIDELIEQYIKEYDGFYRANQSDLATLYDDKTRKLILRDYVVNYTV